MNPFKKVEIEFLRVYEQVLAYPVYFYPHSRNAAGPKCYVDENRRLTQCEDGIERPGVIDFIDVPTVDSRKKHICRRGTDVFLNA